MSTFAQVSEVVNWCQFVPLRGPIGVRHVAPDGEDYCVRHQRNIIARETKEVLKRAEEDRTRRMKAMEQQLHSISVLESQQAFNTALDTQERELQQRLRARTRSETRSSKQISTTSQPPMPRSSPSSHSSSRSTSRPTAPSMPSYQPPVVPLPQPQPVPLQPTPPVTQDIQALINAAVFEALRKAGVNNARSQSSGSFTPRSSHSVRSAPAHLRRAYLPPSPEVVSDRDDDSDCSDDEYDDSHVVLPADDDVDALSSAFGRAKIH